MIDAAIEARRTLPTRPVCTALGLPRASFYREIDARREDSTPQSPLSRRPHPRALSPPERQAILDLLHSPRFVDMAPAAVCATLLDDGRYLCSPRTMYRILNDRSEVRERRRHATHPKRTPPQLVATAPNQVWTWDITHLRTDSRAASLKLYVCIDLYSRFVVGWYLSTTESAAEARLLFQTLARREPIDKQTLILHADNGGPMRGQPLVDLLESLGIQRSHSRPRTSNDNPFSESQFKTMKYRPTYPRHFDSLEHARSWCREFFLWYNDHHRHEALALLTPADVHAGRSQQRLAQRAQTLTAAYKKHPNRFVNKPPTPGQLPKEVAINPTPNPRTHSNNQTGATDSREVTK